jgi:hypothetical protein
MMREYLIIAMIWLIFLAGCCKETIPDPTYETYTITGHWNIDQIDSCRALGGMYFNPYHLATLNWTGCMVFNQDSTGFFEPAIPFITDTVTHFTWSNNKLLNRIEFVLPIWETYAMVKYQVKDTLEYYLYKPMPSGGIGVAHFYYFKLHRLNNP